MPRAGHPAVIAAITSQAAQLAYAHSSFFIVEDSQVAAIVERLGEAVDVALAAART